MVEDQYASFFWLKNTRYRAAIEKRPLRIPLIRAVQKVVCPRGSFGFLPRAQLESAIKLDPEVLDLETVSKIRTLTCIYRGTSSYRTLKQRRVQQELLKSYRVNDDVVPVGLLSMSFDVQPIPMIKFILERNGYSKKDFSKLVNKKLAKSPKDLQMLKDAESLDKRVEMDKLEGVEAEMFEKEFCSLLKALGLFFETENCLKKRYNAECIFVSQEEVEDGFVLVSVVPKASVKTLMKSSSSQVKPLRIPGDCESASSGLTPDVFFSRSNPRFGANVVEKRYDLDWIDCKNFIGGVNNMLDKKVIKQAEKYYKHFGPGAVVFKFGYTETFMEKAASLKGKVLFLHFNSFLKLSEIMRISVE